MWHGNYHPLEVMKRLGLEDDGGAVRVGFVHYNTAEEIDRLLAELAPARVSRRREWAALAALVLVSTAFRAWAAVEVPVPWIAPDEMVYGHPRPQPLAARLADDPRRADAATTRC